MSLKVYWTELDNGNFDIDLNGYTCDYLDPSANLMIFTTGSNAYENRWDDGGSRRDDQAPPCRSWIRPSASRC